jgi:hypothetical protein
MLQDNKIGESAETLYYILPLSIVCFLYTTSEYKQYYVKWSLALTLRSIQTYPTEEGGCDAFLQGKLNLLFDGSRIQVLVENKKYFISLLH